MPESTITEQRGFIPCGTRQLYCSLFLPAQKTAALALLIAEPFGEEKRCAARMLTRLARTLAQHNIAALKCDFSGSGDSSGRPAEVAWLDWQQELSTAADFLQQQCPQAGIALFGARAGALTAAAVAAAVPCRALILAEPLLTGTDFLQELEKRQRIKGLPLTGQPQDQRSAAEIWSSGSQAEFAAFVINADFARQAGQADLLADLKRSPQPCPLLLLRVSGSRNFPPSWGELCALCASRPHSQALLIPDKPFWGQLEYYESDSVIKPCLDFLTRLDQPPQET
ncbi:MAG: hypothetical protein GX564_11150 [Oligosphaeraceae bacterium]|nr:hypothetical protein [Oligosphaeraceae bacterium]